jgi:hypothetical protein
MATVELTARMRPSADQPVVVRAVTVIMGTVVGLTFLFGFGGRHVVLLLRIEVDDRPSPRRR